MQAYTVWRFQSAMSGEVVFSVRPMHVDDLSYSHTYQRVMWRGLAQNAPEALSKAGVSKA